MKNALGGIFNLAIDDKVIASNSAHKLGKVLRHKGLRIVIDPFVKDELALLMETSRREFPGHYPLALTLARIGLRLGEALALKWGDIDFHGRFITIQRNFSRGRIEAPRNGKTRRVDMSRQLAETLKELKHHRKIESVRKGWVRVPIGYLSTRKGAPSMRPIGGTGCLRRPWIKLGCGRSESTTHAIPMHRYSSRRKNHWPTFVINWATTALRLRGIFMGHLAPEGNKATVDRPDDNLATIRNLSATRKEEGLTAFG